MIEPPFAAGLPISVTGGSGFLGQALVSRLYKRNPLLIVGRNEGKLLEVANRFPGVMILPGDIADPWTARRAIMGRFGVFHLAAFKHVTMAEDFPSECVRSNVLGSMELVQAAVTLDSAAFIIATSTDKAAQVSGVYGATKLAMERIFAEADSLGSSTRFRIVRYGNVLYSTGSVLCKWRNLLQKGGAITITNPEATRFYWTVEQAIDLLFLCLKDATSARPYVPTMKAVRLGTLLDAMIRKYGQPSKVNVTHLQGGENIHERILENGPASNEVEQFTLEELLEMV